MRTQLLTLLGATLLTAGGAAFAGDGQTLPAPTRPMRVDCRFFGERGRFCYSSAEYLVLDDDRIEEVRLGVGCDYETIFDDQGTTEPRSTLSDILRPRTAALPRVEIAPEGSLGHAGTYTATLETDAGKMPGGVCYVRDADDRLGTEAL